MNILNLLAFATDVPANFTGNPNPLFYTVTLILGVIIGFFAFMYIVKSEIRN